MNEPDVIIDCPLNTELRVSYNGFVWISDTKGQNMILISNMERPALIEALTLAEQKHQAWLLTERLTWTTVEV